MASQTAPALLPNDSNAAAVPAQWQSINVGGNGPAAALPANASQEFASTPPPAAYPPPPAGSGAAAMLASPVPQDRVPWTTTPAPQQMAASPWTTNPPPAGNEKFPAPLPASPAMQAHAPSPSGLPSYCQVPVLFDFAHQQTRSVLLTCAILVMVGMDVITEATLPELFGGAAPWTCHDMYAMTTNSPRADAGFIGSYITMWLVYTPFVVLSLQAASPYAHPVYIPVALAAACLFFSLLTASDIQYCFRIPQLSTSVQLVLQLAFQQSYTLTLMLHIIWWLASITVLVEVVRLTVLYVVKLRAGALADLCAFAPNVSVRQRSLHPPFDDILVFWSKVPLRHTATVILSVLTLTCVISSVHTLIAAALQTIRGFPTKGMESQVLLLIDACNALLVALWVAYLVVVGIMAYTCKAVATQHDALMEAYVSSEATDSRSSNNPSMPPNAPSSPVAAPELEAGLCTSQDPRLPHSQTLNLDAFDYSAVISYTGTHVLVNLLVFLALFLLLSIVITVIVLMAWFSKTALVLYVFGTIRSFVYNLLRRSSHLMPTSGVCGWVRYLGCTRDRRISRPRWLLFADSMFSFAAGFVWALSNATNRLVLSVVWAIIRVAMLQEPVLPDAMASWDLGFQAHGAMMKFRFLAVLDPLADAHHV